MRTGSIGNRDAESLINTLVEPKKTLLRDLRLELLSLGFSEEADYDPINIESFVSYSLSGINRFIFKHKWNLSVTIVLSDEGEKQSLGARVPEILGIQFVSSEDGHALWAELKPKEDKELILKVARTFANSK